MGVQLRMQPWRKDPGSLGQASLWLRQALDAEPSGAPTPLQGSTRADVCIVGGGFTGLWTALRLRELSPALEITVVEAGLCGWGASGRNSGAVGHWWGRLPTLLRLLGREDALRVLDASVKVLEDIRSFIGMHGIECQLREETSVWSTTYPNQLGAWMPMFKAAEAAGVTPPHRLLTPEEMRELFGAAPYYSGVAEDGAMRVQPALLVRGLRRVAAAWGIRIHETSPVTLIASEPHVVRVETRHGCVRADQVLLAANAWMAHLKPFKPYIAVTSSDMVVTAPVPRLLDRPELRRRPGGVNSRTLLNYSGTTPDGRVYMGRGGGSIAWDNRIGAQFDADPRMCAQVEQDLRYLYPELREVPVASAWSGPIDRSTTLLPWFGALAEDARVHYAIGYSGHGMGATALGGRVLASQILQRTDEWTELAMLFMRARSGWFPPEPIRYLAAHVIRNATVRRDEALRMGQAPSRLDARLAALALTSLPTRGVARP
ncbi:NAD(P)/FAD-dependent oxidoreductase [Ramlibacter rhizophilus]|uniref:FAD-dependent oxidoreductase n=1 Tax=Ramlibacter rhizophilus TaxID=1781167 RepID=A0A4Z0BDU0_9BURK|nr:FAD-binding oxidoreductase [Ramlibacter rhizophilus]TFY96970.1 FAD-dependent oxidoreductase [Ramlibacter rhizophilus]